MKFNKYFKIIMESVKTNSLPTIDVLYDFVKDKRVYNIPIKKVIHELQPTPWEQGEERPGTKEFIARANKADLTYPIIVFKSTVSSAGFVGFSSQTRAAPFAASSTAAEFVASTKRTSRRPLS